MLRHRSVLQHKGDVLADCQPDKLTVRVLQHRSHRCRQGGDAQFTLLPAHDPQAAGHLSRVIKRHQPVNAVGQSAFSAAGRSDNQHFFASADPQINSAQRRLLLGTVGEAEIYKFYHCLSHI
ncbi:hypothetical protein D3C73_1117910 [compost metagenome]